MVETGAVTSGAGELLGGASTLFSGIYNFVANNFLTMVGVIVGGAVLYVMLNRFILNDTRIIVRKTNGVTAVAPARIFFDKKLQAKKISIMGFKLHDGEPPSEAGFFFYKSFFKLYRGYCAIQDDNGVIHFVDYKLNPDHKYYINIITPTKLEQYIASRERAWRKFKIKDENAQKMMLISLIIFTLIISASLAWGFLQQKKGNDKMSLAIQSQSAAVSAQTALLEKMLTTQSVAATGFENTQTVTVPFAGAPG